MMVRKVVLLAAFFVLAVLGMLTSISLGSVEIPALEVWQTLFAGGSGTHEQILMNIRLPRTLVAALVGINLALSGAILQAVMRNPLADPHIIGISSGAGLMGILVMLALPGYGFLITPAAFVGAMGAAVLIYLLAWKNGIQPIRIRAGLHDYTAEEYADADKLRAKIKRERMIEFMAEGKRYFDLRRWMDAPIEENKRVYGLNVFQTKGKRDEFMQVMADMKKDKEYDMVLLMITDVLKEGTELLFLGDEDIIAQAFSDFKVKDNHVFLKKVVSRKKQVVPALAILWG